MGAIANYTQCYTTSEVYGLGGVVNENQDGSVSVFIPDNQGKMAPMILGTACCSTLNPDYIFDIDKQLCMWRNPLACSIENTFKITLNPSGNDGSIFFVGEDENCSLDIQFDYLFKVKCETLSGILLGTSNDIYFNEENDVLLSQIALVQSQIIEQNALCQEVTNQVELLGYELEASPYSITCFTQPAPLTDPILSTTDLSNFSNTAFGGNPTAPILSTNDLGTLSSVNTASQTGVSSAASPSLPSGAVINDGIYCLTDPRGLTEWSIILGPVDYQRFLDGDPTSFTCAQVNTIVQMNLALPSSLALLNPCNIPFGYRTVLLGQLDVLLAQQQECANTLAGLNQELVNLGNSLTQSNYSCKTPIDFFESLDVSMTLDAMTAPNTNETVYEATDVFPAIGSGNLYSYLTTNTTTGFYVGNGISLNLSGAPQDNGSNCALIVSNLTESLLAQSGLSGDVNAFNSSLSNNVFASGWRHYKGIINDPDIISAITNKEIKITLKLNHTCGDVCILLDNIELNKTCTRLLRNDIFISKSPGFEMERVVDNKKSWLFTDTTTNRDFKVENQFGSSSIRDTNYDLNNERLIINSKEIDLDISLASAIETDVWAYIKDNPCILSAVTSCDPCVEQCCGDSSLDFNSLLTESFSGITIVENIRQFLVSELIDAKNRQTISGYPTLRALYDRYLNSYYYCGIKSSEFDYVTIDQFAGLVGNYWVDIVEQVIPATTLWGSVKIYSNTIFDQQKFRYKAYSSLFCTNEFEGMNITSPINGTSGETASVEVKTTTISPSGTITYTTNTCDAIKIAQMNHGSEFVGTVRIFGQTQL